MVRRLVVSGSHSPHDVLRMQMAAADIGDKGEVQMDLGECMLGVGKPRRDPAGLVVVEEVVDHRPHTIELAVVVLDHRQHVRVQMPEPVPRLE